MMAEDVPDVALASVTCFQQHRFLIIKAVGDRPTPDVFVLYQILSAACPRHESHSTSDNNKYRFNVL